MQLQQVREKISDARVYWKKPPTGRYMSFREIIAYSFGGNGIYSMTCMYNYIMLTTTSVLLGNTIGIYPNHLYIMYVLATLINIPFTALRASIVDNVKNKAGKYRPYLISMGIPTAILCVLFVWMPYENMSYTWKCVAIFLISTALLFFYNFFYDSYESLIYVLSPNTIERTDVTAIKAIFYSLAPSIIQAVVPLIAGAVSDGNIYDINVYRYAFPPIAIIGVILTIVVYANTQEKIVQAKSHSIKISFMTAFRAVAKNKYFWIISLASWIGFLEGAQGNILQWLYNYRKLCGDGTYSLITLIIGNASFWGMLVAPFAVRKLGKRKVLIFSNILNIIFILMIYPARESLIWVVICFWLNYFAGAFALIFNPGIQADIRDFQHWKTGERIDGMFAAVGLIGSFVTMLTSSVMPTIYENLGINSSNGYANPYDILYDINSFDKIIGALILFSALGAFLNVIPMFFYDLKETTQQGIIRVLKIRAMFEDYGNGVLDDKTIVEAIDIINNAEEYYGKTPKNVSKKYWKEQFSKARTKEESAAVKQARKEAQAYNTELEVCNFVLEELHKFQREDIQIKLAVAKEVYETGLNCAYNVNEDVVRKAKELPRTTDTEKQKRKEEVAEAKDALRAKKIAVKHFPNGITEFDRSLFDELFEKDDDIDLRLTNDYKAKAELTKNHENIDAVRADIAKLKAEKKVIKAAIDKANKDYALYTSAAKPYIDARKLIVQSENYEHLGEIAERYDEATVRIAEEEKRLKEESDRLEAAKKEEKERLKAERKNRK